MTYKHIVAVAIVFGLCVLSGSNGFAQRHGGFGGGGFGRSGSGFNGGGFRGAPHGGGFGGRGFHGDRFHHRQFGDRFVFFGDFGDPFLYDSYYGYYPYGGYSYAYGYDSYGPPVYRDGNYSGSLTEEVQVRLALAGYYHGPIDGLNGSATQRAIREYDRVHGLPANGRVTGDLLRTMRLG